MSGFAIWVVVYEMTGRLFGIGFWVLGRLDWMGGWERENVGM